MIDWLINLAATLLETLRRLWQRVTGRTPLPVPVRAQKFAFPFSRLLIDHRTPTGGDRRGRRW